MATYRQYPVSIAPHTKPRLTANSLAVGCDVALALRIFAKEVVVMTSRPGTRWGLADSITAEADRHIAGYKLPKATVFCARPQRSPYGKADDHGRKPEWHKLAERMSGLIRHSGLRRRRYRMCPPRN